MTARADPEVTAALGLASEDRNGYVREEAVQRLATEGGPEAIPFLLVRLNDWVPEVRAAALEGLLGRLTGPEAASTAGGGVDMPAAASTCRRRRPL